MIQELTVDLLSIDQDSVLEEQESVITQDSELEQEDSEDYLARPLNALTRKETVFEWTQICQESFDLLKTSLMTDPILTYPDPNLPYVLFTDASKYAWACVLTQEKTHVVDDKEVQILHPITYMSGLFKGNQIEIKPSIGGPTQIKHIKHVKYIHPADPYIKHVPDYSTFG